MIRGAGSLAVFGGSFDPPHVAHVLVASYVLATQRVDELLVIPTFEHPLAKTLDADFNHRIEMCELAMRDLRRVTVSRIEGELGGESRTLRTLLALRERRPEVQLRLIIGADILGEVDRWHAFDQIRELAPPIVIGRAKDDATGPDAEGATIALAEVSSTEVRERLGGGRDVSQLVPSAVETYIREHGLYGTGQG